VAIVKNGEVLITGAGGIGSYLVEALIDEGYNVVVRDNLGSVSLKNTELFVKNPRFSLKI